MMTKKLLMNLLLMLIWVALTGSFEFTNFAFGFIISFGILWLATRDERQYFKRFINVVGIILYFFYELIKANIQVAYDVVSPKHKMKPGIVKVPLDAKTDVEISLLATMISLTPGTLIVDVSDDRKVMYIHAIMIKDKESFIRSIKTGFEKRLLTVLR